jgi:hypothetical protein
LKAFNSLFLSLFSYSLFIMVRRNPTTSCGRWDSFRRRDAISAATFLPALDKTLHDCYNVTRKEVMLFWFNWVCTLWQ